VRRSFSTTNLVEAVNGQLEIMRRNSGGYFQSEDALKLKLGMAGVGWNVVSRGDGLSPKGRVPTYSTPKAWRGDRGELPAMICGESAPAAETAGA